MLYAFLTLLIPRSKPTISTQYLKYLEKPSIAEQYNWPALIKDNLFKAITSYKVMVEITSRPWGDLHCLMVKMFFYV